MNRFLALFGMLASGAAEDPDGLFERDVLPILRNHCLECHSHQAGRARGGLYLDSRSGWETGGDSGRAIVPGNPDRSLLLRAVRPEHEELQMPPEGERLSPAQVAVLERWIREGAIDPRVRATVEAVELHWAFLPVRKPDLPPVRQGDRARTAVDRFVLHRLEERGMQPSGPADRDTLVRRVHHALIGLPPSPEEIDAFVADRAPDAFERLVDRLLASPHYGERWGRHWLDIARYADTKGYVFEEERRFPYAYTYRDYVVDALNRDLPYDRFLVEQLAADRLELQGDNRPLAALGFLTLGRRFLNNQHDIIDDRIDVVARGLMGLTVTCARCHDHKYDPIPTADYYSLYGVFASSREPAERPLLAFDPDSAAYRDYRQALERKRGEWETFRDTSRRNALSEARARTGEYLKVLHDARGGSRSEIENLVRERKLGPVIAFRWLEFLEGIGEGFDPVFAPWLEATRAADRSRSLAEVLRESMVAGPVNPVVRAAIEEEEPATIDDLARIYGGIFAEVESDRQANGEEALPDPAREELRRVLHREGAPPAISPGEATALLDVPTQQKIRRLKRELDGLSATHPGAPARAMSLEDRESPVEPVIFLRGKPGSRGDSVPRQFLAVLEGEERRPFTDGSGRLELARAITSPGNPLTARVIVNRVWKHHFGRGLVETPSDFGTRADPPSHPDLLDWLAATLVEEGWSLKRLHRRILLSAVWRQSSSPVPLYEERDPENRWLWRMDRRRLELEPLRDTLLHVSGVLDVAMGGRPVEIAEPPFVPRRSIYGYIERQNLPGMFRTFDLASPDSTSPGRFETTVPQQALFLLNSPFVLDLARNLERRIPARDGDEVDALFLQVLQRRSTPTERRLARGFLDSVRVWRYGHGPGDDFRPFTAFTGSHWGETGEAGGFLDARGGRAVTADRELVRRWVAPRRGTYRIRSRLRSRGSDVPTGLVARIRMEDRMLMERSVASEAREAGFGELALDEGQAVEFAVGDGTGTFDWRIRIEGSDGGAWDSVTDFSGPEGLSPLAQLAQTLLLSNELAFVD